ncbi:MAG: hypothetical protein ACM32E_18125 [Gemmatimonadota bacterium]
MNGPAHGRGEAPVTGGAYAMLLLLGLLEGLIGCFQFGRSAGPVPVAALALCLVLFVSCWLAGLGMRSAAGALAVAVGWFISSFVLSLPTGGGSVIITNTSAGLWYLYGGAVVALAAVVLAYLVWSRPGTARR